jgi:hypothetical protein
MPPPALREPLPGPACTLGDYRRASAVLRAIAEAAQGMAGLADSVDPGAFQRYPGSPSAVCGPGSSRGSTAAVVRPSPKSSVPYSLPP